MHTINITTQASTEQNNNSPYAHRLLTSKATRLKLYLPTYLTQVYNCTLFALLITCMRFGP